MKTVRVTAQAFLTLIPLCIAAAAPVETTMPSLGGTFTLHCGELTHMSSSGDIRASGEVRVRSEEFDLDCDNLAVDGADQVMTATGSHVQLQAGDITAITTSLRLNIETGDITLTRFAPGDTQPRLLQRQEGGVFDALADRIHVERTDSGESVASFDGNVTILNSGSSGPGGATAAASSPGSGVQLTIPGLGDQAELTCDALEHSTAIGIMTAEGSVAVLTPDLRLECDDLEYREDTSRLLATGDEVFLVREGIEALCNRMTYHTDIGRILLERRSSYDPQPELWQEREEDIFHAIADVITVQELEGGGSRVLWEGHYMLESVPREPTAPEPSGSAAERTARRYEGLDDLLNPQIDPAL
ncbi:hypothetical protein JXA47_00725 [Candidatus Sumerlaeota bacterium]|nr:hypothetical protein [Candidatus Sumerlaeota bacterium]